VTTPLPRLANAFREVGHDYLLRRSAKHIEEGTCRVDGFKDVHYKIHIRRLDGSDSDTEDI